jgi:hypothetical protein
VHDQDATAVADRFDYRLLVEWREPPGCEHSRVDPRGGERGVKHPPPGERAAPASRNGLCSLSRAPTNDEYGRINDE